MKLSTAAVFSMAALALATPSSVFDDVWFDGKGTFVPTYEQLVALHAGRNVTVYRPGELPEHQKRNEQCTCGLCCAGSPCPSTSCGHDDCCYQNSAGCAGIGISCCTIC